MKTTQYDITYYDRQLNEELFGGPSYDMVCYGWVSNPSSCLWIVPNTWGDEL